MKPLEIPSITNITTFIFIIKYLIINALQLEQKKCCNIQIVDYQLNTNIKIDYYKKAPIFTTSYRGIYFSAKKRLFQPRHFLGTKFAYFVDFQYI